MKKNNNQVDIHKNLKDVLIIFKYLQIVNNKRIQKNYN